MWGQGVYGAEIYIQGCFGGHFSHRLSLLLNIQIEKSDNFDPQFLKLALPLVANSDFKIECKVFV